MLMLNAILGLLILTKIGSRENRTVRNGIFLAAIKNWYVIPNFPHTKTWRALITLQELSTQSKNYLYDLNY